jgi:hypothetical protein
MIRDVRHMGEDIHRRLEKIESEIERQVAITKRRVGELGKDEQLEQMRRDVGGDLRLGRVRSGRGAKIGARYTIRDDEVRVGGTGPVPLVANPMPPHEIAGKRGRRLQLPSGFRSSVRHPGTPGKDTWEEGAERARPKITAMIGRDIDGAVRRSFESGG